MTEYDEARLEELMRAGLAERAGQADTAVDLRPDPAASGHRWRTPLLAAAAVAVALVVAVPVLLTTGDDPRSADPGPIASEGPTEEPTDGVPAGWRVEAWEGVQVQVPGHWAVGGAPMADGGSAGLIQCGGVVDGNANPVEGTPYVGRPVGMSDMCITVDPSSLPEPTAPYVWLGTPVDMGSTGWSNGYEAETVEVNGVRVTVATDDPELREQILATVEATGATDRNGCPAVQPGVVAPAGELTGEPDDMSVCAYSSVGEQGRLLWSGVAPRGEAAYFVDAVRAAAVPADCRFRDPYELVVLYVHAGDSMAGYVVDFECGVVRLPPGAGGEDRVAPLTLSTVRPWGLDGIKAYVVGPGGDDSDVAVFFRGMMG